MDIEDFVPYSFEGRVALEGATGLQTCLEAFLEDLLRSLGDEGCTTVGHIKGMMTGVGDPLFFSITRLDNNLRFQGGPLEEGDSYGLTMNVIVAGVEEHELTDTFHACVRRWFQVDH